MTRNDSSTLVSLKEVTGKIKAEYSSSHSVTLFSMWLS